MFYKEQAKQLGYTEKDIDLPENDLFHWKDIWSNGEHIIIMGYNGYLSTGTFTCTIIKDGDIYYQCGGSVLQMEEKCKVAEDMLLQAMKA